MSARWQLTAHAASQHLHADDRLAFLVGSATPEDAYDRFCNDGSFDLYDS
ncbi:MAG: hypothetical protein U5L74_11025 [Ideonella sp.]|nr:hypothetical protein [Ideonella sp.]